MHILPNWKPKNRSWVALNISNAVEKTLELLKRFLATTVIHQYI